MNSSTDQHYLAIDYGEKVIGLASFAPSRDPFPIMAGRIIVHKNPRYYEELLSFIDDGFFNHLILGVPKLLDGKETKMSEKIRQFGEKLQKDSSLPLSFQDETLSTYEAEQRMKNSPRFNFKVDPKQIDSMSALIILEEYIKSVGAKSF